MPGLRFLQAPSGCLAENRLKALRGKPGDQSEETGDHGGLEQVAG